MASVKVMRAAFGRHLEMAFEHMDCHDTFGAMRSQARKVAEEKQRHRSGSALIQRLLAVPSLTGMEFLFEPRCYFVQIERVLRRCKTRFGMLTQTSRLLIFHEMRFPSNVGHRIEELVVLRVAALAFVYVLHVLSELNGLNPLDHLESKLRFCP